MEILRKAPFKILGLCALLGLIAGCVTIGEHSDPKWDFKAAKERLKRHPLPQVYIIHNSYNLGWLYNKGTRFTDSGFQEYVYGLDISKRCKRVRFIYKRDMRGRLVIKYAVLYFN